MWVQLAIFIVTTILSHLLAPKPPVPAAGKGAANTATEGTPIPVVFGEVLIRTSNVVWYGDLRVDPIKA
ncbi:MAG: hypothetical protein KGI52_03700 [Burkholderiales bacterium]|nr:hypothetical protein [Burkholderiales bacterium]